MIPALQGPIRGLRGPEASFKSTPGLYWVDFDSTVIYLGPDKDAVVLLEKFNVDEMSRFKHVVLLEEDFGALVQAIERLVISRPALRTIILRAPP